MTKPSPTLTVTYPVKTSYYVGDKPDFSDLKVQIYDKKYIEITDYEVAGFDSSKAVSEQKITITVIYKEKTYNAYFYVEIKAIPEPNPVLLRIELSSLPAKVEYKIGENFNPDGGIITLYYSNDSTKKINLLRSYVSGFDSSTSNDNLVLTVSYTELGVIYITTFSVRIVE